MQKPGALFCSISIRLWWLLLFTLPFICGFGPPRLVDDSYEPAYRISTTQLQQWADVQKLEGVSARAVLVFDLDSETILFSRNAESSLPPASLTKLMTALLVLEKGDLQSPVTVSGVDLIGNSNMGLQVGEVLSVEALLYGLLINSANDAAMALARHQAGNVDDFVVLMNQRAAELNLSATTFRNPHGLDEEGHVSSARDLLTLVRTVWAFPLFREIVGIREVSVSGHPLLNTNEFLGIESNVNGVKTGTTDLAGECLITGLISNGHQRFVVVLGSGDRYADSRRLTALAEKYFPWQSPDPWQLSLLNRGFEAGNVQYFRPKSAMKPILLSPFNQNALIGQRKIYTTTTENGVVGEIVWMLAGTELGVQPLYNVRQ